MNIAVIVLAAFLGMAAVSVRLWRNYYRPVYLLGIWLVFLIIAAAGTRQALNEEYVFLETWKNTLLSMANSFAHTTEIMGHAGIVPETSPDTAATPAYKNLQNLYALWCKEIPLVARVYTLRLRDDKTDAVSWIISCKADINQNHRIDPPEENAKEPFQPCHKWSDIYRKGFDGNLVIEDKITSIPSHNVAVEENRTTTPSGNAAKENSMDTAHPANVITAVAPLRDPEHPDYVEAILVADFRVDRQNDMIRQIRWSTSLSLITVFAVYLTAVYWIAVLLCAVSRLTTDNKELANAKKFTDAAAKAKNDFLANMNHDIRTPMNVIVGFTEILMHRLLQNGFIQEWEESKGILEIIQKNSQDLLTIISDFLDFSQIEANLLQIESAPLALKQLVDEVGQREMSRITEKKLHFSIQYKDVPELILGDSVRLRQILTNLLDNAVKFTEKGKIEVHCETPLGSQPESTAPSAKIKSKRHAYPESTILKISVHDTGIGISPEQMEYLFQPFAADHSLTHEFGGTGLGLSIAKRLAQLMDGNITVKSEPNVGSVFTLTLHIYLPAKQEASTITEERRFGKPADELSGGIRAAVHETVSGAEPDDVSGGKPDLFLKNVRILLVEDMVINQMVISAQLRNAGAKVEIAGNGELGIKKITEDMDNGLFFDVVLMDMQMPVMDGYEAAAQLRAQGYNRPIIAVTAHALTGDRDKTIKAGCDDYISKPVDRRVLIETIKKNLKQKK
ncbi:MAG: response regulator [Planctomycetaceae bacterium]|jgi:signal transduction histidine kinase/CheY-like chemotaxis protein|nr:response regulator [Planctomycetaceae bacterium]